jgi:LmbE family N-acetylglucosaminyl deacetylase
MEEHLMTTTATPEIRSLLGVWAHPDDEAYLSSALMASVRRAGGRVAVATATRGEHGTPDPETWPPDVLAELRERELLASLGLIDVHDHAWLGHADGALPDVPFGTGVAQVAALIKRTQPDVVVTFGPDGMTGHPDHQTVSAWVTEAWRLAGCPGDLWYATTTPEFNAEWDELHRQLGVMIDEEASPVTPRDELALELHCDAELLDLKYEVLRAHASQTAVLEEMLGTEKFRAWWATEFFVAARP